MKKYYIQILLLLVYLIVCPLFILGCSGNLEEESNYSDQEITEEEQINTSPDDITKTEEQKEKSKIEKLQEQTGLQEFSSAIEAMDHPYTIILQKELPGKTFLNMALDYDIVDINDNIYLEEYDYTGKGGGLFFIKLTEEQFQKILASPIDWCYYSFSIDKIDGIDIMYYAQTEIETNNLPETISEDDIRDYIDTFIDGSTGNMVIWGHLNNIFPY